MVSAILCGAAIWQQRVKWDQHLVVVTFTEEPGSDVEAIEIMTALSQICEPFVFQILMIYKIERIAQRVKKL
jgi:hypothetical protein